MNIIAKLSFLLLVIITLTSCFNPNNIEHISAKLLEVKPVSLNSVVVVIEQKVQNDAKKIEIKDSSISVSIGDKVIGKIFLEESVVIEKGRNTSLMVLKITLQKSIFNYGAVMRDFASADSKVYIDGYVKIKYGMMRKKLKIKSMPIDASRILNKLDGISI